LTHDSFFLGPATQSKRQDPTRTAKEWGIGVPHPRNQSARGG
jgi:hypothetical protein